MSENAYRLSDVTVSFDSRRVPVRSSERKAGPYPYYGASGVVDHVDTYLFDGDYLLVAEDGENLRTRKLPVAFMASGKFWVNNHAHVLQANDLANTRFLCLALNRLDIGGYLSGSTQPKLTQAALNSITLTLPSRALQDRIVEIVSALDDKIAVNERNSATVGLLTSAIFTTARSGAQWELRTFEGVADVYGGGTPSTAEPTYWDGNIAWATPTDITKLSAPYLFDTEKKITQSGLSNCASLLHPPGSIFMTSRATIGRFAVNEIPAATNQGSIVVRRRHEHDRWWLLHELSSRVNEMVSISNGSTFLELSRRNFKQMPVAWPEDGVRKKFHAMVDPLHKRASGAMRENRALAQLRDTLLPRLMSGELRIKDAERMVSDAV